GRRRARPGPARRRGPLGGRRRGGPWAGHRRGDRVAAARPGRERRVFPVAAGRGAAAGRRGPGPGHRGRPAMTQQPAAARAASHTVGTRTVLVVAHTGRDAAVRSARYVVDQLAAAGLAVRVLAGEAAELARPAAQIAATPAAAVDGAELVVVIGGDGTLLRAAE